MENTHSPSGALPSGILPAPALEALVAAGGITLEKPLVAGQIQPASLDLRLGAVAHRVRASFLPGARHTVADRLKDLELHRMDLGAGAVLETGCVYIVPLLEALALGLDISAAANPKSSTGRLDIFTRVIADHAQAFDTIPAGYQGPLYAEISPRTFPVLVRTGSRLSQIRFRQGASAPDDAMIRALHAIEPLISNGTPNIRNGLALTVDLRAKDGPVGFRARRHAGLVDVDKVGALDPRDYWEPLTQQDALVLEPDQFYILASREAVRIPATHAAEMVPFDPLVGEFRVHYAGFFDPGFGDATGYGAGARAVLEVRSHEVPFILEHGQIVGRLVYEALTASPPQVYGQGIGSNYQAQGLKLSKHFRPWA